VPIITRIIKILIAGVKIDPKNTRVAIEWLYVIRCRLPVQGAYEAMSTEKPSGVHTGVWGLVFVWGQSGPVRRLLKASYGLELE
jgi:hypothetical protein